MHLFWNKNRSVVKVIKSQFSSLGIFPFAQKHDLWNKKIILALMSFVAFTLTLMYKYSGCRYSIFLQFFRLIIVTNYFWSLYSGEFSLIIFHLVNKTYFNTLALHNVEITYSITRFAEFHDVINTNSSRIVCKNLNWIKNQLTIQVYYTS